MGNQNREECQDHAIEREVRRSREGTYFSKSGAKSAALDSLVKPVTYRVFLGIWIRDLKTRVLSKTTMVEVHVTRVT